ncbi:MAG: hypothetical protein K9I86_03580 [Cryomorphaceae bacterium]|nr:hypothetical protein [Cryomorphaceae bacterium]
MLRTALILAAILALASCSLQLDSQYGLRLGPAAIKRDVPGGKLANPEQIVLHESENKVLSTEPTDAIESERAANPNYSVEFDASILSDQSHSTDPAKFDIKTYSESGNVPSEAADPKPEGQALQDAAENSQSKPLWLVIVAFVISIPLMIISLLLIALAFFGMVWEFYPFHIFILGIGILGMVLGYLLFRWAKRKFLQVRMPGRSLDPKARLFLGLVLGLLVILLTGF